MRPGVALAALLAATPALAAPMGDGVEAAAVLLLEADPGHDVAAKALTNALRQRVLDSKELTLNSASPSLIATAYEAKCPLKGLKHPMVAANDRAFDAACLRRVGAAVDARRFFWGFIYLSDGAPVVRLHVWQQGQGDRVAELPYDANERDRLADRLYKKLVTPAAVGDLKLSGGPAGELIVDGKPAGAYVSGAELTLETGEHLLEVRDGPRVLARGRARVEPGGRSEATMMPVAEPAPAPLPPQPPYHDPPPVTVRPKAAAWPWVLGGVGVAGLAGAGIFWGLRSGERSDLERVCDGRDCPPGQEGATDRVNTYRTLSAVSLGVGVAAGAGLAAYLLAPRRAPAPVSAAVVPLAGGAGAGVVGRF
ncbi:MAG TPA: hypothetical protein VFS43_30425 [Polyangiaceae bacterium]|nr:hypothetical protein [Polyangiaceae bacterium]